MTGGPAAPASNLQVLGQFVTSLNRKSSEVMRLAGSRRVVCCVYCRSMLYHSVFVLGGGFPSLLWVGVTLLLLGFRRIASLCGVIPLISQGCGVPDE